MNGGTLHVAKLPQVLNCCKKRHMISQCPAFSNAPLRIRGNQPVISAHCPQRHPARPTPRVHRRGCQPKKRTSAASFDEAELAELDDSLGNAEAELEAQFVEETRSQGGGSLARGLLADPGIEGNPLNLLKVSEAYWTVRFSFWDPARRHAVLSHLDMCHSC